MSLTVGALSTDYPTSAIMKFVELGRALSVWMLWDGRGDAERRCHEYTP